MSSAATLAGPVPSSFHLHAWDDSEPEPAGENHSRRVLGAAVALLRQGIDLLSVVSPEAYASRVPVAFNGSIGGHYRHCLDHFASLLRGCDSDFVDYDHRARDPRIEQDPDFARRESEALAEALEALDPRALEAAVSVRCEVSYEAGDSPVTRSSLGRELVYAIAHGIHHFALIAVMARIAGVTLPRHFGVAPSTVAHLAAAVR